MAPWVVVLLAGCARNNPEFGLDGDAGPGDGTLTASATGEGSDTTRGEIGASGSGTTAVPSDTDATVGQDSDSDGASTDASEDGSGGEIVCEKLFLPVVLDTFVDDTEACDGSCAELNFGDFPARQVGTSGPGSPSSVYLMELQTARIPVLAQVDAAHLHIHLFAAPESNATVLVFPVPDEVIFGTGTGTAEVGSSTWSHRVFMNQPWVHPADAVQVGGFETIMEWAQETNAVISLPVSADELAMQEDPLWVPIEFPPSTLFPLELALQNNTSLRLAFTVDPLSAEWFVRAEVGDGLESFLEVDVCD